jgi:hypothetical protein
MQIDDIKQTELDQSERDVLKADAARWKLMGSGSHLDDWLAYGSGLRIRRRLAMKLANVNRPEGRGYGEWFAALIKADGMDHMDKTSITAVLWLDDQPERMVLLREIREAMNPGQRSRLNSPITARKRVEQAMKARESDTEKTVKLSPVALLKDKILERDREILKLEQKLTKAKDESLFDIDRDRTEDIAAVIVGRSKHRAKKLAADIAALLKKQQAPAG